MGEVQEEEVVVVVGIDKVDPVEVSQSITPRVPFFPRGVLVKDI